MKKWEPQISDPDAILPGPDEVENMEKANEVQKGEISRLKQRVNAERSLRKKEEEITEGMRQRIKLQADVIARQREENQ